MKLDAKDLFKDFSNPGFVALTIGCFILVVFVLLMLLKIVSKRNREKKAKGEKLWRLIGYVNISRSSPKEMIGTQNLSNIPDWIWGRITTMVDPEREFIQSFPEDDHWEYKFKPRYPEKVTPAFYIDVCKRQRQWKKFI